MSERAVVLLMFAIGAAAYAALGQPLLRGSVPPNWIYGFRVPQTVRNPEVWYPANAFLGRWMTVLGFAIVLLTAALYFSPLDAETCALALVGASGVGVIAMLVAGAGWLAGWNSARRGRPPG